ncbi:MAG: S8 family peptidase [Terriglobia bacterium]
MRDGPHRPILKSFVIAGSILQAIDAQGSGPPQRIPIIVCLKESAEHPELGVEASKEEVKKFLADKADRMSDSDFYVFASLFPDDIKKLADCTDSVYQLWLDETTYGHLLSSADTVKATSCWRTFDACGKGITWAVMDTGINADHPHFATSNTVNKTLSRNFSSSATLDDQNGHGTHVAGIVAGKCPPWEEGKPFHVARFVEEQGESPQISDLAGYPSGVAPLANLLNIKVLNDDGTGSASAAIRGLEYLRKLNDVTRGIQVDGVNMSLGYPFDPQSYGCGYSPLCQEVTRAVESGLIVVISCGNWGYGKVMMGTGEQAAVTIGSSITDPANTEGAICVGSVHKSSPHRYGVSYFSSKGPTADGRMKPDLVAPGEKIISCHAHPEQGFQYKEASGTSAAAPHVSGAIAAFLSGHKEFRGDPERIKQIFVKTATDLGRDRAYQGAGMVDLLRAMMSV